MHPLQQQINDLRKQHEALGTKLASLERHLEADEVLKAPTMDRQNCTVSSDFSVMHEGRRYSFKYSGAAIENVLILKAYPLIIQHADGVFYTEAITNVREVKEPAKEWEIVEFLEVADNALWTLRENGKYTKGYIAEHSLDNMRHINRCVDSGDFIIHAVHRLTDGTVWRVGTITTNGRITGFEIKDINMMVSMDNGYSYPISLLTEAEALFTTADGVPCYAGDKVCCWGTLTGPGEMIEAQDWMKPEHFYSTLAAAQAAYDEWLFKQPVLTLRDLEFRGISGHQWGILKQFVKDKIAKK